MGCLVTFEDGSSAFLSHHGVKGMKWGVWNEETRARRNAKNAMKTTKAANEIVKSLPDSEKDLLGADRKVSWIKPETERKQSANIDHRSVVSDPKTGKPASFVEVWGDGGKAGQIAVATRSGKRYRGKGYASQAVKETVNWFDNEGHKNLDYMEWIANNKNVGSINLAKKHGFLETSMKEIHPEWGDKYPEYTALVYRGKEEVDKVLKK